MTVTLDTPMWIEPLIYLLWILFSIASIGTVGPSCRLTFRMKAPFPVMICRSLDLSEDNEPPSPDVSETETMRRIHLAISTGDIERTVRDYTRRLGCDPCVVVPGEYVLWRTDTLNLSVRRDATAAPGSLRHLGWENADADEFSTDIDVNGIVWEDFSAAQQADEIERMWPGTGYTAFES